MSELPDGPTEASTDRDGAFSYATEWHAFAVGLAIGYVAVLPAPRLARTVYAILGIEQPTRSKAMAEAKAESWYAAGGVVAGGLLGVVTVLALAWAGVNAVV